MKKVVIALLALTASARADLIDITPNGFSQSDIPLSYQNWSHEHLDFPPDISLLGIIQEGVPELLGVHLVGLASPTANITWDFTGTGYSLHFILLYSSLDNYFAHLYGVRAADRFQGNATVTIDGVHPITFAYFWVNHLPDAGATAGLFGLGLLAIGLIFRRR